MSLEGELIDARVLLHSATEHRAFEERIADLNERILQCEIAAGELRAEIAALRAEREEREHEEHEEEPGEPEEPEPEPEPEPVEIEEPPQSTHPLMRRVRRSE